MTCSTQHPGRDTDPGSLPGGAQHTARARATLSRQVGPTEDQLRTARRRLHAKAGVIAALTVTSYVALVFGDIGTLLRMGAAVVLALAIVAIGTSVMHDANHGAFGRSRRSNRIVARSADLLGASSTIWQFKHNTLHHANTNVVGIDNDIDQAPFARLAPQQRWRPWHRYQHVYLWVLYGFLTAKWFVVSDIAALIHGGIGQNPFTRRPGRRDVAMVFVGKLAHLSWAIVIPMLVHPWWGVLAYYLAVSWLVGFLLAMIFQLAHCTDVVDFLDLARHAFPQSFEQRQLRTTADVRCRGAVIGPFARWLMGGLDHQIEHHLAPRLPHTAYPGMARRLEALCSERGLAYRAHPSIWAALASHGRWLRTMGRRPAPSTPDDLGVPAAADGTSGVREPVMAARLS